MKIRVKTKYLCDIRMRPDGTYSTLLFYNNDKEAVLNTVDVELVDEEASQLHTGIERTIIIELEDDGDYEALKEFLGDDSEVTLA